MHSFSRPNQSNSLFQQYRTKRVFLSIILQSGNWYFPGDLPAPINLTGRCYFLKCRIEPLFSGRSTQFNTVGVCKGIIDLSFSISNVTIDQSALLFNKWLINSVVVNILKLCALNFAFLKLCTHELHSVSITSA